MNLTPDQRAAFAAAYRQHNLRVYRINERANGDHRVRVRVEHPDQPSKIVGDAVIRGDAVIAERLIAGVTPYIRDKEHFAASILETLRVYRKSSKRALHESFDIDSDPPCSSSLPLFVTK